MRRSFFSSMSSTSSTASMRRPHFALTLLAAIALAACSAAPVYRGPEIAMPAAFKEAPPAAETAQWKLATPADGEARGAWWTVFGDPALDRLVQRAESDNASLQAALARVQQSRALLKGSQAERMPRVEAGAGPTRSRPSPASQGLPADADVPARTLWRAQVGLSYEVDLFGRVANQVQAANADADQTRGLYESLRLALQADVVQAWFMLRGIGAEIALLDETVRLREREVDLVSRRRSAGEVAEVDLARSRTELAVARADAVELRRERALVEHALAVLVGTMPSEFAADPPVLAFEPLHVPAGLQIGRAHV